MAPRKIDNQRERVPVVALVRVSSLQQAAEDKGGIPAQQQAITEIAERHHLDVKWQIEIEGVSGCAVMRTPQMKEVLRIVQGGQCKGIVLKEESRLMRPDNFEDYAILEKLEKGGVKIYLVDGVLDLSKASDKLFSHVKFAFAGYERTLIRNRMLDGKKAKRRRGEWVAGSNAVPYGLQLIEDEKAHHLAVDPSTIGRVQQLFDLFTAGETSFGALHRQTGISYDRIPYMLANPIYTGYHVPRRVVDPEGNVFRNDGTLRYQRRVVIPEEEREHIRMLDESPVSEEQFAMAQRLLALKREMRWKQKETATVDFAYRGLLRCADCGRNMLAIKYSNRKANNFTARYYVCRGAHGTMRGDGSWAVKNGTCTTKRIRAEVLEPMLDNIIADRFANPDFLRDLIEADVDDRQGPVQEKIEGLERQIAEADRAIERNQQMYLRGMVDWEKFEENQKQIQAEKKASQQALSSVRPNLESITPEMWVPMARQFQRWRRMKFEQKRALLMAIAPVFSVAGRAGKKYHETVVKVTGCQINLTGETVEVSTEGASEEDDGGELVSVGSPMYSEPNTNQSSIFLSL